MTQTIKTRKPRSKSINTFAPVGETFPLPGHDRYVIDSEGTIWRTVGTGSPLGRKLQYSQLPSGHFLTCVDGKSVKRAHAVWIYHNRQPIPDGKWIDHIDGNPSNDNPENLRVVTRSENNRNRKLHVNNTSGLTGVCWCKKTEKWIVHISLDGTLTHLGRFSNRFAAYAQYTRAAKRHFQEFRRVQFIDPIAINAKEFIEYRLKTLELGQTGEDGFAPILSVPAIPFETVPTSYKIRLNEVAL